MGSPLQIVMVTLIDVFHKYSQKEGDKDKLSKAEVKTLIQEQYPEILEASKDPKEAEKFFAQLDANKDDEVDFQEFVSLVAGLTVVCHELFCGK